jgi:hypothetical protein
MLKAIGVLALIVVAILIISAPLYGYGLLNGTGLYHDLIELEIRAFNDFVELIKSLTQKN